MRYKSIFFFILLVTALFIGFRRNHFPSAQDRAQPMDSANCWTGAGLNQIPVDSEGLVIRYGRALISNTSYYFGPKGVVAPISNGMNCQNCHLEAGTKPWGNNYGAVASTYPKKRDRSGTIESISKRVNDCIERSLNGTPIDSSSKEMMAIIRYIQWLGKEVPKNSKPKGSGIEDLPYLSRAANSFKGMIAYKIHCSSCHKFDGSGKLNPDKNGYLYPPLWGPHSFNDAAGMFRLSRLAGFIKNNMPHPTNYHQPKLSNEMAWDIAAYINAQPRPHKKFTADWPDIHKKPIDHPFGPFADSFTEIQHKYGPFQPIVLDHKTRKLP